MIINKIYNEDNLDTMKRMPNDFIDLTVTSPPYDDLRDYEGYAFDFENVAKQLFRVTKKGGVVVWVVGDATIEGSETGTSFKQALYFKEIGFNLHDTMIYKTHKPPLTHNRYEQEFEYMFILSKGKPNTFNPLKIRSIWSGDKKEYYYNPASSKETNRAIRQRNDTTIVNETRIRGNIFQYATGMNGSTSDKISFEHPAIFPEKLAKDHIYSWSNEGDLIYDPFGGSGTVAKMAHLQKRNWILSELSSIYRDLAQKRIQPYLDQLQLF